MNIHREKRRNLRINVGKKVVSAIAAGVTIAIVLWIFQYINFESTYGSGSAAIIFASVGASAFILFVMPKSRASRKMALLISYMLAGIVGYASYILSTYLGIIVASAVAIAVVGSLMVILRQEHPPAAGLALAFVLYHIDVYGVIAVILIGFVIIVVSYFLGIFVKDVEKEI